MTPEQEIAGLKAALRESLNLNSLIVGDLEFLLGEFDKMTARKGNPNMPSRHFLPSPILQRKQKLNEALRKIRDILR
jgi:hypothetical protein